MSIPTLREINALVEKLYDINGKGEEEMGKEIRVLGDKISFGFNTKEIALSLCTSSCRDSNTK